MHSTFCKECPAHSISSQDCSLDSTFRCKKNPSLIELKEQREQKRGEPQVFILDRHGVSKIVKALALSVFEVQKISHVSINDKDTHVRIQNGVAYIRISLERKLNSLMRFPFHIEYQLSNATTENRKGHLEPSQVSITSSFPGGEKILQGYGAKTLLNTALQQLNQMIIENPPEIITTHVKNITALELYLEGTQLFATVHTTEHLQTPNQ